MALILEVVRTLFQTFHLQLDSLIQLRFQIVVCAYPKNRSFVNRAAGRLGGFSSAFGFFCSFVGY